MNKERSILKKIDGNLIRLLLTLFVIVIVASSVKPDNFPTSANIQSIMKQLVEYGLLSLGVGVAMISGGIDLSTVYIANLSGIVSATFMKAMILPGISPAQETTYILISVMIAFAVGIGCGFFNGLLIAQFNIPPMLATLGTFQLYMGIGVVVSKGTTISRLPTSFSNIGNMQLFGLIPVAFVIFILVAIVLTWLMSKTKFGIRTYLVGTNPKAAEYAGINRKMILIKVYIISGILSSIAGLISLARINSAKADFGSSYTMTSILIAVLGGINPDGGSGSVSGIAVSVIILQVLSSFLNMFPNISNYYRDLIWGVALIGVLVLNHYLNKKKSRKMRG
jgi:simple sugar transport system permease protein